MRKAEEEKASKSESNAKKEISNNTVKPVYNIQ